MRTNEFIFSNKPAHRITRHLVFWGIGGFCFWLQSIMPESIEDLANYQPYKNALIGLACFQPCCILCVYTCIYWILPKYFNKQKFIIGLLAFIPLFIIGFCLNYAAGTLFFDLVVFNNLSQADWLEIMTGQGFWSVVMIAFNNLCWAICMGGIALGIKFSKHWYLQQQENLELIRKKTRDEIQYQKAQIQPTYLSRSLECIYYHIQNDIANASTIVLKLSELLSYSLYESKDKLVSLEKEVKALQDYIYLEQVRKDSPRKIELNILRLDKSKRIPPMLLLSMIQDIMAALDQPEVSSFLVTVTLNLEDDELYVQLSFSELDKNLSTEINWKTIFLNARKKLELFLLPEDYEIKSSQQERLVKLKVRLNIGKLNIIKSDAKGEVYESA